MNPEESKERPSQKQEPSPDRNSVQNDDRDYDRNNDRQLEARIGGDSVDCAAPLSCGAEPAESESAQAEGFSHVRSSQERPSNGRASNGRTSQGDASSSRSSAELEHNDPQFSLRSLRAEAEIYAISKTLEYTGWNRRRAAQLLSISYRGILYKIRQHNLTPRSVHAAVEQVSQVVKAE